MPADLKPFTLYRCATPGCAKSSIWTGANRPETRRDTDGICSLCREPMLEVVDDGTRWRLSWEMGDPHGARGWAPITKETADEHEARDQFEGLLELQARGEEIRNVRLERSTVAWEEVATDG